MFIGGLSYYVRMYIQCACHTEFYHFIACFTMTQIGVLLTAVVSKFSTRQRYVYSEFCTICLLSHIQL